MYKEEAMKKTDMKSKINFVTIAVLFILFLIIPVFVTNSYRLYFFSLVGAYIVAASGMDILVGFSGQMSFGHVAYLAVGGYISTLLSMNLGLPPILTIFIGAFVAAGVGALVAIPCAKLKAQFLVLATIAFSYFIYTLICNLPFLNPFRGLQTPNLKIFGMNLSMNYKYSYYFSFILVIICLYLKHLLSKSKVGRAMMAVRDNTASAEGMGINVRAYKILAFCVSAFLCGLAGAYMAHLSGYIVSDAYKQPLSFAYIIMIIFGGVNSLFGPVIGALVYQYLNELLASAAALRSIVYGLIVLLMIAFMPGGIMASVHKIRDMIAARFEKNGNGGAEK